MVQAIKQLVRVQANGLIQILLSAIANHAISLAEMERQIRTLS